MPFLRSKRDLAHAWNHLPGRAEYRRSQDLGKGNQGRQFGAYPRHEAESWSYRVIPKFPISKLHRSSIETVRTREVLEDDVPEEYLDDSSRDVG